MTTISETIQQWKSKALDGGQLMRSLVSYPHWQVPLSEEAAVETVAHNFVPRIQFNRDAQGTNRLMLWSSDESYLTYRKHSGVEDKQHFLNTTGTWVFGLPLDGIDEIWVDPFNEHDIFYRAEQFPQLKAMAAAVAIEKDIADLRHGQATDGAVVRLRDYADYQVVLANDGNGQRLMLAPDSKGRALAAIFTADDALEAYLPRAEAEAQAQGEQIVTVPVNGQKLFSTLANMNLEGLVFNCEGPVQPIAFAAGLSQVVLEA